MAYYFQREHYQGNVVSSDSLLTFDQEVALSQTNGDPDFIYHESGQWAGTIEILRRGQYLIVWELTQVMGCPSHTDLFQLKYWNEDPIAPEWVPMAGVSTHLHTANATGFAILQHSQSTPKRVGLFQVSKGEVNLSNLGETTKECQKARILFYGLCESDGDLSIIYERIRHLEEGCCLDLDNLMNRITNLLRENIIQDDLLDQFEVALEAFETEFSDMIIPPLPYVTVDAYSAFPGIQINVQRVGNLFYFWCDSTLTADVNLSAADTNVYLLRNEDFVMDGVHLFDYFPEVETLHFHLIWNTAVTPISSPTESYFSLRVDKTGIYVRKVSTDSLYVCSNSTITFNFAIPMFTPIIP